MILNYLLQLLHAKLEFTGNKCENYYQNYAALSSPNLVFPLQLCPHLRLLLQTAQTENEQPAKWLLFVPMT